MLVSELEFHKYGDRLCGRYCIAYTIEGKVKFVGDAVCSRAVFYSNDASIVGSHAKLVAESLSKKNKKILKTPFKHGHPGRFTPYDNVFLLTPNVSVEVGSGNIERFFPRENLVDTLTADDIYQQVKALAKNSLDGIRDPLLFSLSAGLDSRTTLAAAVERAKKSKAFTHAPSVNVSRNRQSVYRADVDIAKIICERNNIPHKVIYPESLSLSMKNTLSINSYKKSYQGYLLPMIREYGRHNFVHVRSNILEIGRTFYHEKGVSSLSKHSDASHLFLELHKKIKLDKGLVCRAFEDFYNVTRFSENPFNYDFRDLFYWEHRMPAWHAQNLLCTDVLFDTFNIWNCRYILSLLLSLSFSEREEGLVQKKIIGSVSSLDGIPINP